MTTEPWRYRCPREHTNYRKAKEQYYCATCRELGHDPYFDDLKDMKAEQ